MTKLFISHSSKDDEFVRELRTLLADQGHQIANDRDVPSHLITYIRALQAIVAGSRDRGLAGAPDLDYAMAAEILLLIETLENVTNSP